MASLQHLPMSMMMLVSNLARRSAANPPVFIEIVITSSGLNPSCNPVILNVVCRDLVVSVLRADNHRSS